MKNIIGIKWGSGSYSDENIRLCSALSWHAIKRLMERFPVTYNQILFPYADALSLSEQKGTESTKIFGTHLLLGDVSGEQARAVLAEACGTLGGDGLQHLTPQLTAFHFIEGSVSAEEIAEFLHGGESISVTVGDFCKMLSGFVPHWRIREAARIYASFTEIAYRQSKGAVIGLCGGKTVVCQPCESMAQLQNTFFQKTGCH